MNAFLVQKQIMQLSLGRFQLCNFWCQNLLQKSESKTLMKLTSGTFCLSNFIQSVLHFIFAALGPNSYVAIYWKDKILVKISIFFVQKCFNKTTKTEEIVLKKLCSVDLNIVC